MIEDLENLNVPNYYAFASLYFFGDDGIGRRKLSDRLGLSESRTRTMIQHLQREKYIETENITKLSDKGLKVFKNLQNRIKKIKKVEAEDITSSDQNIAALVQESSKEIEKGLKIRDEAVRAGANGLTALVYEKGFKFPDASVSAEEAIGSETLEKLNEVFCSASENDVLLICSAERIEDAKAGLWSALQELLTD